MFRKKRTFRKRRFARKRTFRRKSALPRYDGMVRVKFDASKEATVGDGNGIASFRVDWGDQDTAIAANVLKLKDCPELPRYFALYRYFKIQGVSIRYMPYQFNQGSEASVTNEELLVGSSATGSALDGDAVRLAVDFHVGISSQKYRKYVGVAKSRRLNSGDTTTGFTSGSSPWISTEATELYHAGATQYIIQNLGLAMARSCGIFYVTYYMWLKGQRTNNA